MSWRPSAGAARVNEEPSPETDRGELVRGLFLEALGTEPRGRSQLLERTCGGDTELRQEVERLLDASADAEEFLTDLAQRAIAPLAVLHPEPALAGRLLGAYRLVREIGRGGMGAVYLAERADDRYEKQVAVKLLPLGLGSPGARERFLAEQRVLARLEHPGIARLVDAGVAEDGTPYFVLEYVEGETVTSYCDGVLAGIEDRLRLFLQICDAVEYAHRRRILHRDLKPANIMVTPDGRVKLLDFGIAKMLDGDGGAASTLTQWGGSPLTPSCASPEQVAGMPIGVRSDVYQLGVLLYQLLTGCAPYSLTSHAPTDAMRVVMEQVPAPPSEPAVPGDAGVDEGTAERARLRATTPAALQARLLGDLDHVVLKALRKEPERRYATVAALARDIERYLNGTGVLARPESGYHRARAWLRRQRSSAALATAAVVVLGAVGLASFSHSAADHAAARLGSGWPDHADITSTSTRSRAAFHFYQEGMRAHYQGNASVAYPLFAAATREDSTFALAWFYLGRSSPTEAEQAAHIDRAHRLAHHGTERERLLIGAHWAELMGDASLEEVAGTLAARYPDDVDGHFLLGVATALDGNFLAALPHFERVVGLDSAGSGDGTGLCRGCDALERMVNAYVDADSLAAAERTARRWIRLHPGSALAWQQLAWTLWRQDRGEEALRARHESTQRRATTVEDQMFPAMVALRVGDYATADALLAERLRNGTAEVRRAALFWQTVSFRYQGRLEEALGSARRQRELVDREIENPHVWQSVGLEAHVLFELGRFPESAALIDSAAAIPFGSGSTARDAQHLIWVLAHATTVAMAAGDTARVRVLADRMEALGRGSSFARNRQLHHYGRGMLSALRGDVDDAVTSFRIATQPSYLPRASLEFARLLIADGQPLEAAAALHVALRGPMLSGGVYTTRPELHELLGRAWEAAGQPDSAAANYRKVIDAWQHADPQFTQRRQDARRRVAAMGG
jgi:serine/threonine protein kinase/tetratricopeptide (TPR) repeat protein